MALKLEKAATTGQFGGGMNSKWKKQKKEISLLCCKLISPLENNGTTWAQGTRIF